MTDLLRASWILFSAHLVRTLRARRMLVSLLLALGPVALALVVTQVQHIKGHLPPIEPLMALLWFVAVQTILPLVCLIQASSVIAEEIEDRTITYLFTRPIPRPAILIGRWLAAALPIALLLVCTAEVTLRILRTVEVSGGVEWLTPEFHLRYLLAVALGGAVYSGLFAAIGALVRWPLLVGLGYTFIYEVLLGNFPGSNQKTTVTYYLRSLVFEGREDAVGHMREGIFSMPLVSPASACVSLGLILAAVLFLGTWRFARREYVLAA